jgi:hypothetical protein
MVDAANSTRRLRIGAVLAALVMTVLVGIQVNPAHAMAGPNVTTPTVAAVPAGCQDSICLFSDANFGGSTFNAGFPSMSCAPTPFPTESATNDIIFHVELYSDASCQVFDFFLESGTSNANLPAPVRSYKTFICGQACLQGVRGVALRAH